MLKKYNPESVHKPAGAYVHVAELSAPQRTLYLAGQGGRAPDGTRGATIEEQTEETWRNILRILSDADMGPEDIVRVTTYVIKAEHRDIVGAIRSKALGGVLVPGTFLVVSGFANPDMLIEIDVVAAR